MNIYMFLNLLKTPDLEYVPLHILSVLYVPIASKSPYSRNPLLRSCELLFLLSFQCSISMISHS